MRHLALILLALAACNKESPPQTIAAPPPAASPPAAPSATPSATPTPAPAASQTQPAIPNPVTASFVDLSATGTPYKFRGCEALLVAVAKGNATAAGEKLSAGDVLVAQGVGEVILKGSGLAVLATVDAPGCAAGATTLTKKLVKANAAPDLVFAGGKMHARLDVEKEVSPNAYLGRLSGTAAVAEHSHPDSWEILCAVDAAGTFTLDGKEQRLGPRQVVAVPPATRHAWKPDEGSSLVALQLYAPPGPEQRFKALAADAGAKK
jgi:mannose-6-phosphate isomerase-like protein (cupin superfamily)